MAALIVPRRTVLKTGHPRILLYVPPRLDLVIRLRQVVRYPTNSKLEDRLQSKVKVVIKNALNNDLKPSGELSLY
ncbi:hypothetical protein ACLKA7_013768 [Drosophila subpalustris]